jgi:glucose-6-phosphate isomerase
MRFATLALLATTHAAATKSSPAALAPRHQREAAIDALRHHINEDVAHVHLRELLEDEDRCAECTAEACGVYLDYSRQKVTATTIDLLINVARACNVEEKRDAMFRGEVMNPTEQRSVRHVSLRATRDDPYAIEEAQDTLDRVLDFARAVRCKRVKGASGEALTDVVAIGIGGSSLGPACVHEALASEYASEADGRRLRFIANVDPVETDRALQGLDPASTLVIVISKTFTTKETMLNAALVKRWLGERYETHMCAVTAAADKASEFGCERVFAFGDYVGGRYSVWSPVGCLPLALQYGVRPVREFLRGARAMDFHFREAPLHKNLPVVLALVGFLNAFIYERDCRAVLPYARALSLFPRYVQQLEMESNGKGVDVEGNALTEPAGEVVFGEAGTPGQHSFYQLLHQVRSSPPPRRRLGARAKNLRTRRRRGPRAPGAPPSRRACANTFATTRGRAAPNAVAARVAYEPHATAAPRAGSEGRALRVPRRL